LEEHPILRRRLQIIPPLETKKINPNQNLQNLKKTDSAINSEIHKKSKIVVKESGKDNEKKEKDNLKDSKEKLAHTTSQKKVKKKR